MCASPQALSRLTLPDGSSRTASQTARGADLATKQAGGCLDIPAGATVSVVTARKNTSIVTFDAGDGRGSRSFVVPNIDFAPAASAARAGAPFHQPAWPDENYPPLANANRLFAAVHARCPRQGWNEHLLSHTETGAWDAVYNRLSAAQHAAIEREQQKQCEMGLSCPADIAFGMEVQMGHLRELVAAICTQKAPPDW